MISPEKYARLSRKRQVHWLLHGLQELEQTADQKIGLQDFYQNFLAVTLAEELRLAQALERQWQNWRDSLGSAQAASSRRELEALLLQLVRLEPSDWSDDEACEKPLQTTGLPYLGLYLDRVRSPFNMGSIFRTAAAFGVRELFLHPHCPSLEHPRAQRSAMGCMELLQVRRCEQPQREQDLASLPWLALETPDIVGSYMAKAGQPAGQYSIATIAFPPGGGLLLVGSEEDGLRRELLEYCASAANRQRGGTLLSIPMPGVKQSLNLGVAAAIALQRWSEALQHQL